MGSSCAVDGCENDGRIILGWCESHWRRNRRHGDPLGGNTRYEWPDNLLKRMEPQPNGCIYYTGNLWTGGYGTLSRKGRKVAAHRAAYELLVGPIPEGMELDHTCHDPERCAGGDDCLHRRCVNVEHLNPTTPQGNTLRSNSVAATNAAKTHCIHGHEFTPENTKIDKRGGRACRECGRGATRRYMARKRAGLQ